jgi:hypothetical protein
MAAGRSPAFEGNVLVRHRQIDCGPNPAGSNATRSGAIQALAGRAGAGVLAHTGCSTVNRGLLHAPREDASPRGRRRAAGAPPHEEITMNELDSIRRIVRRAPTVAAAMLLIMGSAHAAGIAGVWKSDVTIFDCASHTTLHTFTGLQAFHADGTLSDTNSTDPASRSPGMGTWHKVGRGQFTSHFTLFLFAGGTYIGYGEVWRDVVLGEDGNTATGSIRNSVYDPSGNLLGSACGSDNSVRFQ